jgi:hypothetical protein
VPFWFFLIKLPDCGLGLLGKTRLTLYLLGGEGRHWMYMIQKSIAPISQNHSHNQHVEFNMASTSKQNLNEEIALRIGQIVERDSVNRVEQCKTDFNDILNQRWPTFLFSRWRLKIFDVPLFHFFFILLKDNAYVPLPY